MALSELQITIISYAIVFLLTIIVMAGIMQWFPFKYLIVKGSRGGKKLLRIHTHHGQPYYKIGRIDKDGFLFYKEKWYSKGTGKRIELPPHSIKRDLGIDMIDIDQKGRVVTLDWEVYPGFDAEHLNNFFVREAEKPAENNQQIMILIFVSIISLLILLFIAYTVFKTGQKADMLLAGVDNLRGLLLNQTITLPVK